MVDWDLVDRRRAKGWDWDRIAEDPKVGFHAEESAGDSARALRALYYQRRSKARRRSGSEEVGAGEAREPEARTHSPLATYGYILVPIFAIWFIFALAVPSPVGAVVPALPYLGLLLAGGAFVLAFGLLRSLERWNPALRTAAVVGVILGFAVTGGVTLLAVVEGCPTLTTSTTGEPNGWIKASNPAWNSNGAPVFFFYGSTACPFCAASSWALVTALRAFGSVTGVQHDRSDLNPQDYPATPEIVLASLSLQSQYVALHIDESTDHDTITVPATPSCIDQAYVSAYNPTGGIPFVVIGGKYIHTGTFVAPPTLRDSSNNPLTWQQVQAGIDNQTSIWTQGYGGTPSMSSQVYMLEAIIVTLNHGQPATVANDPNVQIYLNQMH